MLRHVYPRSSAYMDLHRNVNVEADPRVTDRPVWKQTGHMGVIDFSLIERLAG